MGQEEVVRVRLNGREGEGKAHLDGQALTVRGALRASVPLGEVSSLEAEGGWLRVAWPGGELALELGPRAAKWAEKIRNPPSLLDKLGVKPGHRVSVLVNLIHEEAFIAEMRARGADVTIQTRRDSDLVFLDADEPVRLRERLAKLKEKHLKPDGAIWVVNRKGVPTFKDTDVMSAGKAVGLVDVKIAAFSATHTATKFVVPLADRPKRA